MANLHSNMTGELFTRFLSETDLSSKARRWNGNDATERNHHSSVPFGPAPFDIALHWKKNATATPKLVGYYRLNLENLRKAGYIPEPKNGNVRLRFYHDLDGCVYIEPQNRHTRLLVGRVEN